MRPGHFPPGAALERSDKLAHRFPHPDHDPFPTEFATREQVELVLDRLADLSRDLANLRVAVLAIVAEAAKKEAGR